jgi:Predicted membrane protein (DUF2339)
MLELLIAAIVIFFVAAPIVSLFKASFASKRSKEVEAELKTAQQRLHELTARIYSLEQAPKSQPVAPSAAATATTPPPAAVPEKITPPPAPSIAPPLIPKISPLPTPPITPPPPVSASAPQIAQPSRPTNLGTAHVPPAPPAEPARSWADMEEKLGANWLNKIGTAAFVIGVALLLNYSMHLLGAGGKIALGYALSAILVTAGIIGEKKERYRIAGRAVLGGGWALAYFTTYALHNIASVRLVESPAIGFALLFVVAAAMVAHSLRYHSEVTTGFAYLLAFATIGISEIPLGALIASALLAASLAYVLRIRNWYAIEPLAIIATYAVHWLWLDQIYTRIGAQKMFPEFNSSVALLSTYWAIYLVSYFLRDADTTSQTQLLTASFLLNAGGYLAVLHHQSFHPELRFWFLTAAGLIYFAVSAFSRARSRRLAFILASTLGMTLIVAAVPYRYSGSSLEILWLVEAEAVLIIGLRLRDAHLRLLGWIASALLAGYAFYFDVSPRITQWTPPNSRAGWMLVALAAAFYVNSQLKRFSEDFTELDSAAARISPGIATIFALAAAWVALPFMWTALAWTVIAAALIATGRRFIDRRLCNCGHFAALLALVRLAALNLERGDPAAGSVHGVTLRLITVSISALLLYAISRRAEYPDDADFSAGSANALVSNGIAHAGGFTAIYSAAASFLVADLIWQEFTSAAIALAWGIFALVLLEVARAIQDRPLLIQSRVVLIASFARIFFADLNSTATVAHLSARVITVVLLAAIYFYVALTSEESSRFRAVLLWLGPISIVSLIRFQAEIQWVAVWWAALAVALYFVGGIRGLFALRDQSFALTLLVGVRCAFDNFYQTGRWYFTNTRIATIIAASAFLYSLFTVTQLTRQARKDAAQSVNGNAREPRNLILARILKLWSLLRIYPQHLFFFVPTILLTVLLSLEIRRGYLTPAWGLEALIIFLAVLKMDERSYRWFSLALFVLCVGRIITVDVWNLDALGRIVSFMGLGVTLLAVSFLYARHREVFRKVL